MYTLVLEELEKQYQTQTSVFNFDKDGEDNDNDNKCLSDIIMDQQGAELAGDRHETIASGDQTGWVSGRLTRQLAASEQQVKREERAEKRIALEKKAKAVSINPQFN